MILLFDAVDFMGGRGFNVHGVNRRFSFEICCTTLQSYTKDTLHVTPWSRKTVVILAFSL